jgi:hypothetical protein
MVRLNFGENIVALTLSEKVTISNPTFLFEFINNQGQIKSYFIAADSSGYPDRFNLFAITLVAATPDQLLGEVVLNIGDEYTYNVYQQESTTNLDPALSGIVVESGLMTYDKVLADRIEYTPATETRKIYEP